MPNNIKQVYEFQFKFNKGDMSQQLKAIAKDVQSLTDNLGASEDKFSVFQVLADYLKKTDAAFSAFKKEHKNDFDAILGDIDPSLFKQVQGMLGGLEKPLEKLSKARGVFNNIIDGKSLNQFKNALKYINEIYEAIGSDKRIDIAQFDGKSLSQQAKVDFLGKTLDGVVGELQTYQRHLLGGLQKASGAIDQAVGSIDMSGVINALGNVEGALKDNTGELKTNTQSIDGLTNAINKANGVKDTREQQVDIVTKNLMQLFKQAQQHQAQKDGNLWNRQELSAQFFDDGRISLGYGEKGHVSWKTIIEGILSNNLGMPVVDLHTHGWGGYSYSKPFANDALSGSTGDIGAFRTSKEMGIQYGAMLTGNILHVLGLDKIDDKYDSFLDEFKKLEPRFADKDDAEFGKFAKYIGYDQQNKSIYLKRQSSTEEYHNAENAIRKILFAALKNVGLNLDDVYKTYDLTNETQAREFAATVVDASNATQTAITSVEKLVRFLKSIGVDTTAKDVTTSLESYRKGEIDVATVFNRHAYRFDPISQDAINSRQIIDSVSQGSPEIQALSHISSTLDEINNSVSTIVANTQRSVQDQLNFDIQELIHRQASDMYKADFKIDKNNISEFAIRDEYKKALTAADEALDYIDTFANSSRKNPSAAIEAYEKQAAALQQVQKAQQMAKIYEDRYGIRLEDETWNKTLSQMMVDTQDKLMRRNSTLQMNMLGAKYNLENRMLPTVQVPDQPDDSGISSELIQSIKNTMESINNLIDILKPTTPSDGSDNPPPDGPKKDYAYENTLQATNKILGDILQALSADSDMSKLVQTLSAASDNLKEVAQHINEARSSLAQDKSKGSDRLMTQHDQLQGIASDYMKKRFKDVQFSGESVVDTNGVVKLEGAVQDADGKWQGFAITIDQANKVIGHTLNSTNALAKNLNKVSAEAKPASDGVKKVGEAAQQAVGNVDKITTVYGEGDPNNPISRTITRSNTDGKAVNTVTAKQSIGDDGEWQTDWTKEIKNYQAYVRQEIDNQKKIDSANAMLAKFMSQFNNKTGGKWNHGELYTNLSKIVQNKIQDVSEIDNVLNMMQGLEAELNRATQSARKGSKSMNLFQNMYSNIDSGNIDKAISAINIDYSQLLNPTEELTQQIQDLPVYYQILQDALKDGDTMLIAEAYGELNLAIKAAQNSIQAQAKADKSQLAQLKQLTQLYRDQAKAAAQIDRDRVAIDSDKISDAEKNYLTERIAKNQQLIKDKQREINAYGELVNESERLMVIDQARNEVADELALKAARAETKEENRANKQSQNYGKTAYNRETRNYDKTTARLRDLDSLLDSGISDSFAQKIKQYDKLYEEVERVRNLFQNDPNAAKDPKLTAYFNDITLQTENLRKEIDATIATSKQLASIPDNMRIGKSQTIDLSKYSSAEAAMREYVATATNGTFQFEKFDAVAQKMYGTIQEGNGVVRNVVVAFDGATDTLSAYTTGMKRVTNAADEAWGKLKSGATNLISRYFGLQEAIQAIRQGVTYVREIDSALTELKKVTEGTEEDYNRFLQTMSKTASVIGSTTSELTTMAAEWARLGYSMEESAKLAESTGVLLNVSEFSDATQASEALISTMQAFQYTADDSMHVVDILNEVGNNYAISSDGIATALKTSASALMEGGNNLEQATALVAAANRVVQDPSSVGR